MEDVLNVAAYLAQRYSLECGQQIDESKLHKLMYFTQRECFIQTGMLLFDAIFYGWKYGPVLKEIRSVYENGTFISIVPQKFTRDCSFIFKKVFETYAIKDSYSLRILVMGELSWKNSRIGIPEEGNSDNPMNFQDIMADAERIKTRRENLKELGLL